MKIHWRSDVFSFRLASVTKRIVFSVRSTHTILIYSLFHTWFPELGIWNTLSFHPKLSRGRYQLLVADVSSIVCVAIDVLTSELELTVYKAFYMLFL